jgi:hypothetical protein
MLDETTLNGSICQQWRGLSGGQVFGVRETGAGVRAQTCRPMSTLGRTTGNLWARPPSN